MNCIIVQKGNQLQPQAMGSCLESLGAEGRAFFNELMQQQTEDVMYF